MIATIDVADIGVRSTFGALRRRPADVAGLRWLDIAATVPLSSKRPPGLRRAVMLAMWDDEDAAAAFAATDPLAQRFAHNGFHAALRPLRAFGTWPGLPENVPHARVTKHDGPVIVTTLARLRTSQTVRFMRASRPAERAAIKADGFVWGTAATRPARRPFMATVSVWTSAEAAAAYAYKDPDAGHPLAIRGQRRKDFHHESTFIRYGSSRRAERCPAKRRSTPRSTHDDEWTSWDGVQHAGRQIGVDDRPQFAPTMLASPLPNVRTASFNTA